MLFRKGVSPLISVILVLVFTVSISTAILSWVTDYTKTTTDAATETATGPKGITYCANSNVEISNVALRNVQVTSNTSVSSGETNYFDLTSVSGTPTITFTGVASSSYTDNLAGWWHFDEGSGTDAFDSTTNDNDGTVNGAEYNSSGQFSSALQFDGDDYVTVPDDNTLDMTDTITLSAWVSPSTSSSPYAGWAYKKPIYIQDTRDAWWNKSWTKRKKIIVNGSTTDLTDYQLNYTVLCVSGMNDSFKDIRFTYFNDTTGTQTELPYWVEANYSQDNASVWVKANLTTGNNTVYMYYGNSGATSQSDYTWMPTGGTITTVGGYRIHTFTSNGIFTTTGNANVEVLVVAGGGAANMNPGGGAGGQIYNSSYPVTSQVYPVIVGAGGIGVTYDNTAYNGENSSFSTLIAVGGGGGDSGASGNIAGVDGGSGSGAGIGQGDTTGSASGGSPTSGQGYPGGDLNGHSRAGAGGGGAGGAGEDTIGNSNAGDGGMGLVYDISGTNKCYAGGGGGGSAGNTVTERGEPTNNSGLSCGGGMGDWGYGDAGYSGDGDANTGGGAGGNWHSPPSDGGSGIVIIRYPSADEPIVLETSSEDTILRDYQIKIDSINTSQLYSDGKIQQYCNDTRFTWLNQTSGVEEE
ncbi:DUF2341 domain-containing protein, partial [archaeon]|nr:DUF2341 domain-containing protein [archaeon]